MKKLILAVSILLSGVSIAQQEVKDKQTKTPQETAEALTKKMDRNLDLSDEQEAKILEINKKYADQNHEFRSNKPESKEERRDTRTSIHDARKAEYKAVLTPEQYAKYLEMEQAKKEKHQEKKEQNKGKNKGKKKGEKPTSKPEKPEKPENKSK